MEEQVSVTRAMNLVRRQRHSFLNHLQVISGWLQLGQSDRAMRYLETVAVRMSTESEAVRRAPAPLGHLMLELDLEAETHGVRLEWQLDADLATSSASVLDDMRTQVMEALPALTASSQQSRLLVRVSRGGVSVHSALDKGEA